MALIGCFKNDFDYLPNTEISMKECSNDIRPNDVVRILKYPEGHVNERARVEMVDTDGVYVSNANMPFLGTLCFEYFTYDEISK